MTRIATTLLPVLLLTTACAPDAFRADAGAAFMQMNGHVALQDQGKSLQLARDDSSLDRLGSSSVEPSPYLRLESDWGPQRVRVSGFGFSSSGPGRLTQPFGNIPAGATVETSAEFLNISASWSYDLIPGKLFRLAPGVQVCYDSLDVSVHSSSPPGSEKVTTDVLVPMPYFEGEVDLGPVSLVGDLGVMSATLRDARGRYWDTELMARVRPSDDFELFAGWRYLLMDANGTATGRDFDADVYVVGWFIGGGVRF